eukprot:TRINITY_DN94121_c0_g1_i1.p1 TRINITY_DN94121_c0_g1~~TRINITY_DN94121_c0_g1_i1.p1  ORF type:complete len:541 (-),score=112.60 TRINITY_DN94121_c0_g1_i1:227-1849(-)
MPETGMGIDAFIAKWQLSDAARKLLESLAPETQQLVIQRFGPKEHTKNLESLFQGFAKSVMFGDEACTNFCNDHGLDQSCLDALVSLDKYQREAVMTSFQPKETTRDVTKLFHGFVRSVLAGGAGGPPPPAHSGGKGKDGKGSSKGSGKGHSKGPRPPDSRELHGFCQAWGLDAQSAATLRSQPPDIQHHVLQNFRPKANTRDVQGLFAGFLRSVAGQGGSASALEKDLSGFIYHFGLGPENEAALRSLDPASQREAMERFQPKAGTRNVQALFTGFLRTLGGATRADAHQAHTAGGSDREIWGFLRHWGLGKENFDVLRGQPPEVQRNVLDNFHPKRETRDVQGLFNGFLRSQGGSQSAAPPPRSAPPPRPAPPQRSRTPIGATAGGGVSDEDVTKFILGWGLDEECAEHLTRQTPEVLEHVLKSFAPRAGTRNVVGLFWGFMRSIGAAEKPSGPPAAAESNKRSASSSAEPVSDKELEKFSVQWSLDRECMEALVAQPPDVQRDLMARFHPKSETRDVSRLFLSFVNSRAGNKRQRWA